MNIEVTIIAPSVLGNMCLNINLKFETPNVFDACTNSKFLILRNSPLTTLLIEIHPVTDIAKIIVHIDGSKINTNKITIIKLGIEAIISIILCMIVSNLPP